MGGVRLSGCRLGARVSAQESFGALGPCGQRSFDFVLGTVNVRVHSGMCAWPTPSQTVCRNALCVWATITPVKVVLDLLWPPVTSSGPFHSTKLKLPLYSIPAA